MIIVKTSGRTRRCLLVTSSDGVWDWWETGDICWVPKRTDVSWELAGSKGVEWWSGRVTAKGSHTLVATVRSSPGRITSRSGVSMTWDREVLGLSEIASKAPAVIKVSSLYWRVEVLETEGDVMTRAAGNTDLPASPTRIGGWVVVLVDGTDILTEETQQAYDVNPRLELIKIYLLKSTVVQIPNRKVPVRDVIRRTQSEQFFGMFRIRRTSSVTARRRWRNPKTVVDATTAQRRRLMSTLNDCDSWRRLASEITDERRKLTTNEAVTDDGNPRQIERRNK